MLQSENRIPNHLRAAEMHVRNMIGEQLPAHFAYHSIEHMVDVTLAAREIAAQMGVSPHETELLTLSALFHDTGLIGGYAEHEKRSGEIAADFMAAGGWSEADVAVVVTLIAATQMPQTPGSLLQQILCDADLYHLSRTDFKAVSERLRKEFEFKCGTAIPDEEWTARNITFLQTHRYFTAYGQEVLEGRKQENLRKLMGA